MILSGSAQPQQRAKSIYDQEIRPHEKEIVWYSLRDKLPEIGPPETKADPRPLRAREKSPQTMVSGAKDDVRPSTLIWAPEPEAAKPKDVPLPNVVAMAPPKVVRPFVAPPVATPPVIPPTPIPEPPRAAATDVKAALPLPPVKPTGAPRAFTPPPNDRMQRQAMLPLPEGPLPEMVVEPNAIPFPTTGPRPQPRDFVPPPAKQRASSTTAASLPAPPEVPGTTAPRPGLEKVPRTYVPRQGPSLPAPAAAIAAEPLAPAAIGGKAEASLAIVGLNPAKITDVPAPPASHPAGFSAGPETRKEGGTGSNGIALLNVPGLVVKGGAKDTQPTLLATFSPTSRENLMAAAARVAAAGPPNAPVDPRAPRMAEAPDPRFAGRAVYSIAIQMPNVTSFSGSWLVWFAEHIPLDGPPPKEMRPPVVVRKVDPKYIAAAAAERVQGAVRLFAVIGRDGHMTGITLVRGLDDRLDRSAQEALAKWEFTPALRDGIAIEVDALFEIPFHLAPKPNQ